MFEFFIHEGFKETSNHNSLFETTLDNLSEKCWWNNRLSLFLITDFLLTLLLIDTAHFIQGLIPELIPFP